MQFYTYSINMAQKIRGGVKGRGRPVGKRDVRRVTVALEPDVYDVFKQMAQAAGVSLARTIGDWCRDTADGAHFVTQKVIQARKSPAVIMRDMHMGAADRLNDEIMMERDRRRA